EGAGEVGAAGDHAPPELGAELAPAPFVALDRERRAGGAERAQPREVAMLGGMQAGLDAVRVVGCSGAEETHAGLGGEAPQHAHVGPAGIAVVDADGRAAEESADLALPHDPAGT